MRQLGYMSNSNYININNQRATGTTPENIRNTLSLLGYNVSEIVEHSQSNIINSLSADRIVLMIGYDSTTGTGHMWIVDGYYKLHTIEHLYFSNDLGLSWYEAPESPFEKSEAYNHINWGYGGIGNGIFNIGVYRPNNPIRNDANVESYEGNENYIDLTYFHIYH